MIHSAFHALLMGGLTLAVCAALILVGGWLAVKADRGGRLVFGLALPAFATGAGVYLLCWGATR
jgi:hypothetical protein